MESSAPTGSVDPAPASQLPSYEECKRLPTYEETVCHGGRGRQEYHMGQATGRGGQFD